MSHFYGYECKICDTKGLPNFKNSQMVVPDQWMVYTYKYPENYEVSFVVCDECAKIPSENLLALYKRRIKIGKVAEFH